MAVIDSREGGRFTVYRPGTGAEGSKDGGQGTDGGTEVSQPSNREFTQEEEGETAHLQGAHGSTGGAGPDKQQLRSEERMEGWFDGSASWWTQGPDAALQAELAREIGAALARYGHVMFPGNSHAPALECSKMLLKTVGKGGCESHAVKHLVSSGLACSAVVEDCDWASLAVAVTVS